MSTQTATAQPTIEERIADLEKSEAWFSRTFNDNSGDDRQNLDELFYLNWEGAERALRKLYAERDAAAAVVEPKSIHADAIDWSGQQAHYAAVEPHPDNCECPSRCA